MKRILKVGVALMMLAGCLDQAEPVDEGQTEQALSGPNDRIRVISISNGTVTSAVESAVNSTFFGYWGPLGGYQVRKLIADKNDDGRIMLFVIGGDGIVYARYQTQVGGNWNPDGWGSMGVPQSGASVLQLVTAHNRDGRLEIFARCSDGHTYHRWQTVVNGGWNDGWFPMDDGRTLTDISAALRADGLIDFVGITNGKAIERRQVAPNSGWADFTNLTNDSLVLKQITIAKNAHGYMEMLALDSNGGGQDLVEGIPYQTPVFRSLGGHDLRNPVLGMNGDDGRLSLFAIGSDNHVYDVAQGVPGGYWGAWQDLGLTAGGHVGVASRADGHLVVFATRQPTNSDVIVQSITQVSGGWSPWSTPGASDQVPNIQDVVAIAQPQ